MSSEQKSNLWQEIKSYGNPDKLKWTSSVKDMMKSLKNILYIEELKKYIEFEPFFVTPPAERPALEDYFYPELFHIKKFRLLSDLINEQLADTQANDFPIEWGYYDEEKEEEERYLARSFTSLENQLEAILGKKSDFQDIEVDQEKFVYIKNKVLGLYIPRDGKTVKKSQKGKGNDFQSCQVIDNEFIYCPPSEKCLIDCLSYNQKLSVKTQTEILKFLKTRNVFRFNIPSCHVRNIAEIIGVKFNIYRKKESKLTYKYEEDQIILCLLNSHWIILKDYSKLKECYQYAQENIQWTEKKIIECKLDTQKQSPRFYDCPDIDTFTNIWMQDFEAFPNSNSGQFIPYATGFVPLEDVYKFHIGQSKVKCPTQYVHQYEDSDCIIKMLQKINDLTKKLSKEITGKNGKTKKVTQKQNVYIYAHNGANFDSYFYLNVQGIKCKNMVEKGGIMSLTITSENFKNANFIIRDTRKFLTQSLKSLCKSFKIDEKYCKSEMNHDEVNESNWKSLKSIWSPYLNLDVISLSLIWIKFIEKMRTIAPTIDVKQYCSIAQLSYSVACLGQELPCFKDPYVRRFIQRANRGGRVIARNQQFKTKNLEEILKINNVSFIDQLVGKQILPESLEFLGKDYHIAFDATSLYPSAMSLPHASYLDAENCFILSNDQCWDFQPEQWISKKFIIECDLYAPKDLQFVPLSIKSEYGAQFSTGHLKNVVLNDVDLFECLRFGYKINFVHQGIWSEPVQYGFIKEFVEVYFKERAKVKNHDAVLGDLYKLILNSAYGKFGQKRCDSEIKFTTKKEMENEDIYTDDILECFELGNGQICYKVKKEQQEGESLSPHHIAGYILAYSKQIMNNFVLLLGADQKNIIHYMDTDSFYIHSKDFSKLSHIKDCLGGGKNDYGETKMIIQAEYLGCKSKVCYLLDTKTMEVSKKVTWKGISQTKFQQIEEVMVGMIKQRVLDCDKHSDYITDIDNWSRDKKNGVTIKHGCSKKLSISEYCKKYDLIDGVYHFKHLE